jgi:hypothetical protein
LVVVGDQHISVAVIIKVTESGPATDLIQNEFGRKIIDYFNE